MRDITLCHPRLQALAAELIRKCAEQGSTDQNRRDTPDDSGAGCPVRPGEIEAGKDRHECKGSGHSSVSAEWGAALDVYRADGRGACSDTDGFFSARSARPAVSIGLEGGEETWKSIVRTEPHFQLPDWGSSNERHQEGIQDPGSSSCGKDVAERQRRRHHRSRAGSVTHTAGGGRTRTGILGSDRTGV